MAVKMNLWSMTLLPGEKYPMLVRRDFQITNVALGEELRDEKGRSVVKVTHNPIDPAAFDTDSEIDSDLEDSDDEFDMDGEDSVDEEVDDEEEAEVEAKKKVKAVAKEALKAAAEDAEMDEDEDEDEEDDEDFDSDDEEPLEVNVICSLLAGKVEQAAVNLTFVEGEVVMFEASGENAVHLLGNYIDQFPDVDSDSEFDSDEDDYDDYSALYDDEDDEDESGPEIEELEEEAEVEVKPKKAIKAAAAASVKEDKAAATPVASLKRKSNEIESPAGKTSEAAAAGEGLSKAQKKKLAKKAKLDGADAAPAPAGAAAEKPKPKAQNAPQKRTTASGLIIEDITVGTGPVAKGGKRLGMRYIGKLTSGKQFDANTAGKPFSFVLGRGEVIKGWDEGLVGMAVGGERRLTIPPQLAYGKRASGPIPANSTLKFDVKLVSVN